MYNLKRAYIRRIFTDPDGLLQEGIFFSAHKDIGEYMVWHANGRPWIHCFFKDGKHHGHYKEFSEQGTLAMHLTFKYGKRSRVVC